MKILLFNDNPVVRKLVALSAQKTKDDLSVVWSVEEIEAGRYDLLIVDDALYNDELFASLKETVSYKTTLLMATRGNAVPAGFDHVINKPFLPTDLVDLFANIDASLASKGGDNMIDLDQKTPLGEKEESYTAIDLEEPLSIIKEEEEFMSEGLGDLSDDLSDDLLEGTSYRDEDEPFPAVLDHEEVQEVRGLLEDTEKELSEQEDSSIQDGENFEFDELEMPLKNETPDEDEEEEFDFEGLDLDEEIEANEAPAEDLSFSEMEELSDASALDEIETEEKNVSDDELMLDDMLMEKEEALSEEEPLSDEAFGDLELKIQEAVGDLEEDDLNAELEDTESFDFEGLDLEDEMEETDLSTASESSDMKFEETLEEMSFEEEALPDEKELLQEDEAFAELEADELDEELDESLLESLKADAEAMDAFAGEGEEFDELDMLDEKELKRAVGEEVEDETEIETEENTFAEIGSDSLEGGADVLAEQVSSALTNATSMEGAEALQTLLKALANEDVVKALKGLNISININFGNEK